MRRLFLLACGLAACASFDEAPTSSGASSSSGSAGDGGPSGPPGPPAANAGDTLATGLTTPVSIHATTGGLHWTSVIGTGSSSVLRLQTCPLDGCKGESPSVVDEPVETTASTDTHVFWTSDGSIHACPAGSHCVAQTIAAGASGGSLGAGGGLLYFSGPRFADLPRRRRHARVLRLA